MAAGDELRLTCVRRTRKRSEPCATTSVHPVAKAWGLVDIKNNPVVIEGSEMLFGTRASA